MVYTLTIERREHLLTHFGKSNQAGSLFNEKIFPDPDALLFYLSPIAPSQIVQQSNGRVAHVYELPESVVCGWAGIGLHEQFPESVIQEEKRNGFTTSFVTVKEVPPTHVVTLICDKNGEPPELITAFPGGYAPAFPFKGMEEGERQSAELFWKRHVLLKRL